MIKVVALCLVVLALCHISEANSGSANGICGAFTGSGPHGTKSLTPVLTGLPTGTYKAGQAYTLTITGGTYTGFALTATGGTIALVTAADTQATCNGQGVSHRNKNPKTAVTATWTAPATGDVTFNTVLVNGGGGANYGSTANVVKAAAAPSSSSSTGTKSSSSSSTAKSSSSSSTAPTSDSSSESEPEPVVATAPDVWVDLTLKLNVYEDYPTQDDFEAVFIPEFAALLGGIDESRITVKKYNAPAATKAKPLVNVAITLAISNADYQDEPLTSAEVSDLLDTAQTEATGETLAAIQSYKSYTAADNTNAGNGPSQPSKMGTGAVVAIIVVVLLAIVGAAGGYWYWNKKRSAGGNMKAAASNVAAPSSAQTSTDGWTKVWDENTKHYYYFNSKSSESRWTPPPGVTF